MDNKLNREDLIENLIKFNEETNKTINDLLKEIDWNENITEENLLNTICPFDSNHRITDKNLEQHLNKCQWKAEGYDEQDLPLSIPTVPPDGPSCIKFDESLIKNILEINKVEQMNQKKGNDKRLVPRTSNRFIADYTTEERKILYDYVIKNTNPFEIVEEIADLNKLHQENSEHQNISYLELIAQERNLKRRRAKHRGVHTNKKSHTEILREVINHQMEMFTDHVIEKEPLPESSKIEKNPTTQCNKEKFNNSTDKYKKNDYKTNYSYDYNDDKQCKYETQRNYDEHNKSKEKTSRYSKKSSKHHDKYDERYENKHHSRRDSHDSHHHHHHHHKHKHHKSKDHHRSSSSKKSRHHDYDEDDDDNRSNKRRKH